MQCKHILAISAATLSVALGVCDVSVAAGGPTVKVRVEGETHTLLGLTKAHTKAGSITKGGAPVGKCSATSGAGALDVATKHNWSGTFSKSFNDYFITTILGEKEPGTPNFWSIWVNNKLAQTGACEIKLHKGDQLLFAAIASSGPQEHPLALRGPAKSKVGQLLKVKVVSYNAAGKTTPLAGARVFGGKVNAITNSKGIVRITPTKAGTLKLHAEEKGFIRSALLRVKVST